MRKTSITPTVSLCSKMIRIPPTRNLNPGRPLKGLTPKSRPSGFFAKSSKSLRISRASREGILRRTVMACFLKMSLCIRIPPHRNIAIGFIFKAFCCRSPRGARYYFSTFCAPHQARLSPIHTRRTRGAFTNVGAFINAPLRRDEEPGSRIRGRCESSSPPHPEQR